MYLIQHGRRVCKAQRPLCEQCVMAWGCPTKPKLERAKAKSASAKRKPTAAKRKPKA
jgi:adenine-specific DNA glycosylase